MAANNVTSFPSNSSGPDVISNGSLLEMAERQLRDIYIYPFVFVIFCMVIGSLGNSIVIYIFTVKRKLTKTTIFILTLAGVDLMSCVINMPTETAILWHPVDFDYDVLCKISRYTTFIASASSSFVLIAISIDRYLMICRPFLGRELGVQYARRTCVVAVLLGIVTTWPSLIFYGTYSYQAEVTDYNTGEVIKVSSKTCLITNFFTDNYKLPAGFYFFLFGAHAIMFVMLTLVYMMIGRRLYISTSGAISSEKRHSLKFFGLSMMSAITGSVPNSPADNRDRVSWGGRNSRAVSFENINRIDRSVSADNVTRIETTKSTRNSNETNVTIVLNGEDNLQNNKASDITERCYLPEQTADRIRVTTDLTPSQKASKNESSNLKVNNLQTPSSVSDDSASDASFISQDKPNKRKLLSLNFVKRDRDLQLSPTGRLSSGSTGSPICSTPLSVTSPSSADTVRGILFRSQSIESRARLNKLISDELRRAEVKESSLRRNTLIMRMVTIAFVVSFLPYLVIVTLRYSNTDIPFKLSKAEQIIYHVFLRTYFVNSMINPFIYGFMNEEFRAKIKELFCKFCSNHNINIT